MIVRLDVKHSLLVGLMTVATALGGCADLSSFTDLKPEGPPEVVQVFVLDHDAQDYMLTYGHHPEINLCGFDKDQCTEGFTCAADGFCKDSAGEEPRSQAAIVFGASFRIIIDELLNGTTVEQFMCACRGDCPAGKEFSLSAKECGNCGDSVMTATINETGLCFDANDDGQADLATLQDGIATVTCGSLLTYTAGVGDGYYYPSGNQFPSSLQGFNGLGPAIVLEINGDVLPTNTDCTLALTDKPKDKDGISTVLTDPSKPVQFHTESLAADTSSAVPADGDEEVLTTIKEITVPFNSLLQDASVTATTVTLTEKVGGAAVTAEDISHDGGGSIVITLAEATTLKAMTAYVVTITIGVKDKFGVALPAPVTFEFTTK